MTVTIWVVWSLLQIGSDFSDRIWFVTPDIIWSGSPDANNAKTLDELREKETEVLRDILDGISPDANSATLNDVFDKWVTVKRGLKEVTFNKYKHDYAKYIKPRLGNRKVTNIKASDIRAFITTFTILGVLRLGLLERSTVFCTNCVNLQ